MKTAAAHLLWRAACLPAHRRFRKALARPEAVQSTYLLRQLAANRECAFGRKHDFAALRTVRDFQKAVPPANYADLQPWIERAKLGEGNQLTTEPIRRFEKTSGSSSQPKYIPYTAALQSEFQAAIRAWIADLYIHFPNIKNGPSYWSITPAAREREVTPGGIAVGFDTDAEYLGKLEQWLTKTLFAVPAEIARIADLDTSAYVTLRWLLQTPELALVSIWNPSFLTVLLGKLILWKDALLADLASGTARPPFAHAPLSPEITRGLRADPERAARLSRENPLRPEILWPHLALISCWTSASAELSLPEMSSLFPGVILQGKGLLATEGVVSIPLSGYADPVLAVTSHFYEFEEVGSSRICLAHEVEPGRDYTVLMTTGGGLWRYRLGDRVRVTGRAGETPLLRFLQRDGGTVDLCGEKLSPPHVEEIFLELKRLGLLGSGFAMLAPRKTGDVFAYVLFFEAAPEPLRLCEAIDRELRKNPHYDYCRRLGQLGPVTAFQIQAQGAASFLRRGEALGQRAGNIKPTALHGALDWEKWFSGKFIEP